MDLQLDRPKVKSDLSDVQSGRDADSERSPPSNDRHVPPTSCCTTSRYKMLRLCCLMVVLQPSLGKRVLAGLSEGYKVDWKYVSHFAFSAATSHAPATIEMRAWTFMPNQRLLIYRDDDWFRAYHISEQPPTMFRTTSRCTDRADLAQANISVYQGSLINVPIVQESASFWFLAIARCSAWWADSPHSWDACMGVPPRGEAIPDGVFMYFELTLRNPGGFWYAEFSADEHGIVQMHCIFLGLYILLAMWLIRSQQIFTHDGSLEDSFQRFQLEAVCAGLYTLQHALMLGHCRVYAGNGIGYPWLVGAAEVCEYSADVLFTLLVLLLSKGWCITRRRKTHVLQVATTSFLVIALAVAFVVELSARDPAGTYHRYEAVPARVVAVFRLVLLCWFAWCVKRTYHQQDQEDRPRVLGFFLRIAAVGGAWLLFLPLYVMLASLLPAVYRKNTLAALLFSTNWLVAAALALLTHPRYLTPVHTVDAGTVTMPSKGASEQPDGSKLPCAVSAEFSHPFGDVQPADALGGAASVSAHLARRKQVALLDCLGHMGLGQAIKEGGVLGHVGLEELRVPQWSTCSVSDEFELPSNADLIGYSDYVVQLQERLAAALEGCERHGAAEFERAEGRPPESATELAAFMRHGRDDASADDLAPLAKCLEQFESLLHSGSATRSDGGGPAGTLSPVEVLVLGLEQELESISPHVPLLAHATLVNSRMHGSWHRDRARGHVLSGAFGTTSRLKAVVRDSSMPEAGIRGQLDELEEKVSMYKELKVFYETKSETLEKDNAEKEKKLAAAEDKVLKLEASLLTRC